MRITLRAARMNMSLTQKEAAKKLGVTVEMCIRDSLPYGKQRKLEIARALATDPKLLLLDEPAAGMNPNETGELMETIELVRKKFGVTRCV